MTRYFWGSCAIVLGSWEALAYASGERVPTVTDACRFVRRHGVGQVLLAAWLAGLAWHLMLSREPL